MDLLEDPLDREEFDPVQYINERFPTEASLDELDGFVDEIGSHISSLDEEISKAVQAQSVVGRQATKDIEEAQQFIEDLFVKINDIKTKASQSESMVQDLCADIKKLDYAKNHLQTSITSLNRLQMLINAVNQLELLAEDFQYSAVANLLDAVRQFMTHFEKYKHISIIADLNRRIERIQRDLTKHLKKLFAELAQNMDSVADVELALNIPGGVKSLGEACLVVDALGVTVRKELLVDFLQRQLIPYESLFGQDRQHFSLDQVDRRWAWFKRVLKYIDAKFQSIFPVHWRLPLRLCLEFVERTKLHLILMLTEIESKDHSDVHALLKALQSALKFEQEMTERFHLLQEIKATKEQEEAKAKQRMMEQETQRRLKNDDKLMYIPTDHGAANHEEETESGFLGLAHSVIAGGISGVFDKFLGPYVLLEKQNLEDMLIRLGQEEDNITNDEKQDRHGNNHVYNSSMNMFVFIKNSIKRCIALTNGQTFLALSEEFRHSMRQYVQMLKTRCPQEISKEPLFYRLLPGQEVSVCYLINTGEYCAEVAPQLEQMIQQKIQPNLANKVNFQQESDIFMDLVAHGLKILVHGMMDRLEPAFKVMQNTNWGIFENVGEESSYLHTCNALLMEAIPNIRKALSASYFSNFCTKLAAEIMQRYLEAIVKQKKISDMATQQLLLDTYSIKTLLLHLPNLNPGEKEASVRTSPVYAKLINAKVAHVEVILKLVGTPEDMLLERFRIMWPDGQPVDLQMLMGLKGTKRSDQQVLLEMFGLSSSKANKQQQAAASSADASQAGNNFSTTTSAAAASAAASAAAFSSSMKSLTQDLSSQARNAVGNLKWTTNK